MENFDECPVRPFVRCGLIHIGSHEMSSVAEIFRPVDHIELAGWDRHAIIPPECAPCSISLDRGRAAVDRLVGKSIVEVILDV
jgi:hypothetical protein